MYDACIIGAGGVVGCALARELSQRGLSVIAIEKHPKACQETSGLNSRVIHSGFHETRGTLKARLAREGSEMMIDYALQRGIPLLRTGMLIAVPRGSIREGLWREAMTLWNLWRRGRRQNVDFKFIFTAAGIRRLAPIDALGGIFIPSVCVVDVEQLVSSFEQDAQTAGARFCYGIEATEAKAQDSEYRIALSNGETIRTRLLINSAGLRAHEISLKAGGPQYRVEVLRGDYYELAGGVARWNIRTLVYPAMPPRSPSKGVHFGPRTDGRLFIGPSATPADQPMPKELFLQAGRKFLPNLTGDDLLPAYSGLRPKHGSDFVIRKDRTTPVLINLIGIDSPGLSASMGIARYVAALVNVV
jgi:glycerol-3-phosphate dehydrogenase